MQPLPLSMLNAFVYCPRRFYIEFVESDMADNADVVAGRSDHRPLDDPKKADRPRQEGPVLRTRSVWISSNRLGICGRLDLLEERAGALLPVEYKRGKPPPDKPYDNDRIQLAAAAMLLEEQHQTSIPTGVLYYRAEKRRIEVPIDQALRDLTLSTIQAARELALKDRRPEPLLNDPRCPRCSLVGLCLPDEVQALRTADAKPRALLSARLARQVLYVNRHGARVSVRGRHLVLADPEKGRSEVPLEQIQQVVIVGYGQVSTQALLACLAAGIPVAYVALSGRFRGIALGPQTPHGLIRTAYARRFRRPTFRLTVARALASSKIHNQRALLLRNTEQTPALRAPLQELRDLEAQALGATSLASLRGFEGRAGRLYFTCWPDMIKSPGWWPSGTPLRRSRRPPRDPVNALLGLAYTCLTTDFIRACAVAGLDPYLGLYHSSRYGRPALALDLMEPFRPLVADSTVLRLINTRALTLADFRTAAQACYLQDAGRKTFFAAYEQRKAQEITHPVFGYTTSYGRVFEMQARLLTRFVTEELDTYPLFTVR